MLQRTGGDDYVIGTGEAHSVREFAELSFGYVGLDYRDYVVCDPDSYTPGRKSTSCFPMPPKPDRSSDGSIRSRSATRAEMVEKADCKLLGVEAELNRAVGGRV